MLRRFNLLFTIIDEERCLALVESGSENPFESAQLVLCTMSFLSEGVDRLQQAVSADWDLLVVDEAHHLEWNEQQASPAYQAIEDLAQRARGLLLLTATPEQLGIDGHFARLRLLDPARYFDIASFRKEEARYVPVNQLLLQLMADDGLQKLADETVQDQLKGFLGEASLGTLNAALAEADANPAEILGQLVRNLLDYHGTGRVLFRNTRASVEGFPGRELRQHLLTPPEIPARETDDNPDDPGSCLTPELLLGEQWLQTDPRVEWLIDYLQQQRGSKILVICALANTAMELEQHLNLKQGVHSAVFHEGLSLLARDRAAAYFSDEERGAQVLICSEIGSEGRNFQFSSQLVLFDLPLNPDLLEQRIGRLDRIGQRHDIQIHIPCYQQSAQHVLLRWYHEGINAFEKTCAIGQATYKQFEARLMDCLRHPGNQVEVDELIQLTHSSSKELVLKLRQGRDRLLELNSCDNEIAANIVQELHEQDQHQALAGYMDKIFDQFGVEQEHHSAASIIVRPGEHMIEHSFPGLPEDGLTATFRRDIALSREDFHFLTWEHPMVSGAMDMVMNGEYGNTAFCTLKLPLLKAGTILLEAIFTMHCPAPPVLQLHRYLPLTTVRIVVDSKQNDLSAILTQRHFDKLGQRVHKHRAQDFLRHARAQIVSMIEQAEILAGKHEQSIVDAASTKMVNLQQSELTRMRALAQINPNIRQEEIDHLVNETSQMEHYLAATHIKLDALRVAVVSTSK
jgi:ATP-dependent helicase HepA